ncbi:leucine-rich repeat protein [uncultured Porphyromonas sp.]|uniref:leucine-rich repeat protein n=1 Tax=uncultured Porphyromonas sp. TaxID=159274 RepID=UPI0026340BB6|nr:leucine-rich repeat protein [uncultured Porphyromonas sp.]
MQYPLLSEYVSAITHASENLDQLKHLEVVQDEHGEPYRSSGAFAVVFKMRDTRTGQLYALKCFTEEQEGRAEAYRKIEEELEVAGTTYLTSMRYYERELFVDSSVSSESEFPVLLMDWVEGSTMELYIREHYRDSYAMEMLCYRFCRLAAYLRSQPFAHGDVKPDNIMVSDTGTLTLIDYDGMFVPSMQGESSPTLGTEEFRHPLRTPELFDATIDDFALASIALSLRAIALDSQLLDLYGAPDRLLFSASDYRDLAQSKVMQAIWKLVGDKDLCKLVGLFVLAHAEQSLASTSFQLFSTTRPEKPVVVPLSTKVTKEDLAEAYTDEYGVKFSPDRKRLLWAPRDLVSYTIPDTVTTICDRAFYWCHGLTSLTIPNSVTSIGNETFDLCQKLTSLTIPNSVTSIGDGAFYGCSRLTSLTIPNSVSSIGDGAFYDCSSLTSLTIPNSVTSIGDGAFYDCSSLTSLTIPNSVTSIGNRAFKKCSSLTSLTIPESVTSIGDSAFENCENLTSLTIPDSVTSIGDSAFAGCSNLTSLTIPNSLTMIGANPFGGLTLQLDNQSPYFYEEDNVLFTADKKQLLAYCSTQTSYSIPDSVTSIGDCAFSSCSSLITLTIPDSVTSIGDYAFDNCKSLTSLTITDSVSSIGKWRFCGCESLTSLTIPNSVTAIGYSAFANCSSLISLTIPDSVTTIGDRAFASCSSLTTLTIPDSVTTIGDYAFNECHSLTSLTIPNSVTSIGDIAFEGCSSLTSLTIPNSVTTIGPNPFIRLTILLDNQSPHFYVKDNILFTADKSQLIAYCSSQTSYSIPNSVTSIGNLAFCECHSLTSLTIPDSVTSIGDMAFYGCSSLTSLTIPDSVTSMGRGALYGCDNLNQSTREEMRDRFGGLIFWEC